MCYVVCNAGFDSVDTIPDLPPPPVSTHAKKEKRRFRKSLKAVVDKIKCLGKPKPSCPRLPVVEEKEEPGNFVRVDVDVITDAPSLLDTSFGGVQPILTQASASILGLGLESAPELVTQGPSSSIISDVKSSLAQPTRIASAPRRWDLYSAHDDTALVRRPDRVSRKPSRDHAVGCTETKLVRVPLADIANRDANVDTQLAVAHAAFEEATVLASTHIAALGAPHASAPCTLVQNGVPSEAISTPLVDSKCIDEESALPQPTTGVDCVQGKSNLDIIGAARVPALALDLHQIHASTDLSVISEKPATPVPSTFVRRVDGTPASDASISSSDTPDIFSPATPETLVDSSFAPTETSPQVCSQFRTPLQKLAAESSDVSHTFVNETSIKVSAASPDPKALLQNPRLDLPVGVFETATSLLGTGLGQKQYADACVEAVSPSADKELAPPSLPCTSLRLIAGHILSFVAAGMAPATPDLVSKADRAPAAPTIPQSDRGTPCMTHAACEDLRQLIQVERRAADTRRAIVDTMTCLLAKHEPIYTAPHNDCDSGDGIVGYEAFVQRSLAAEEKWERDMGGVVSALMQLACVPRAASIPRVTSSPQPAYRRSLSEPVCEDGVLRKMRHDLAGAAAQKALVFEDLRALRMVGERERCEAGNAHLETVKLRKTGLLSVEKGEGLQDEEEVVNVKKLRYQQYVARKAYEKRIEQLKGQPFPNIKADEKLIVDDQTGGLVVPSTPQKGKISPLASPSRLPMPTTTINTPSGVSVSPVRATFEKMKATVSAMDCQPPSRSPARKTAPVPHRPSRPPVTPVGSRAPPTSRLLPSTSKSLNPRTPSRASNQSRISTPRSSRPTTPCPNRDAHKLATPERKPPVPRVVARKQVGTTYTTDGSVLRGPGHTTRRKAVSQSTTPKATPSRRAARVDENAPPSLRGLTTNNDTASKEMGRPLLRTPLRQKQTGNKSPAKAVFRF